MIHENGKGASGRFVGLCFCRFHTQMAQKPPFGFRGIPRANRYSIGFFMVNGGEESFFVGHGSGHSLQFAERSQPQACRGIALATRCKAILNLKDLSESTERKTLVFSSVQHLLIIKGDRPETCLDI